MPKPKIPNQRKANLDHKKRVEQYVVLIRQVYDNMAREAARLASLAGADGDKPFSFDDYPFTKSAITRLQSQMMADLEAIIMSGTSAEWKESNLVQDLVAKKVLTAYTGSSRSGEEFTRYYQTNPDVLKSFLQRREGGMTLSDRVWNLSEQYKIELEDAISTSLAPGKSAQELSMDVRQCLNDPDLMFRRFRYKDEQGRWKRKWKKRYTDDAGHVRFMDCDKPSFRDSRTGPGYYKSSAKNAMRLARTEINMAYRTAEQERWRQFDFVVGYEVKTTQNGHHVEDICDRLAGKYPKDFKFVGWHPNCMCYCIPILKTEDEFWALDEDKPSVNEVTDVPGNFKEWIADNSDRIEKATERGTLPYFIKDNRKMVDGILKGRDKEEEESHRGNPFARMLDDVQTRMISRKFKDIETYPELEERAAEMLAKEVGNDLRVVIDPELMPLDTAKVHLTELVSVTKDYRLRQGRLAEVVLGYEPDDPDEYGVTTYNPRIGEKRVKLTSKIAVRDPKDAIYNSRCDKSRLPFSLASHEAGHLLINFNAPATLELQIIKAQFADIYSEYINEISQYHLKKETDKLNKISIGDYGTVGKEGEFFAECFQEYRNSSKPSKYAKKVGKLIDSYFKK